MLTSHLREVVFLNVYIYPSQIKHYKNIYSLMHTEEQTDEHACMHAHTYTHTPSFPHTHNLKHYHEASISCLLFINIAFTAHDQM